MILRLSPKGFRRFLTDPSPAGLGTTKDEIRKYLGDSTNPLRVMFEKVAERSPGKLDGNPEVARNVGGRFSVVRADDDEVTVIPNNIRNDGAPNESPPPRDRSREPQAGTSVGYAVRRLERESKDDPEKAGIKLADCRSWPDGWILRPTGVMALRARADGDSVANRRGLAGLCGG